MGPGASPYRADAHSGRRLQPREINQNLNPRRQMSGCAPEAIHVQRPQLLILVLIVSLQLQLPLLGPLLAHPIPSSSSSS